MTSLLPCNICMQTMKPRHEVIHCISVCGHFYHSFCLQQWIGKCPAGLNPVCPSCKQSFSSDNNLFPLVFNFGGAEEGQMSTLEDEDDGIRDTLPTACNMCDKRKKYAGLIRKTIVQLIKDLEMTKTDLKKLLKVVKKIKKLL